MDLDEIAGIAVGVLEASAEIPLRLVGYVANHHSGQANSRRHVPDSVPAGVIDEPGDDHVPVLLAGGLFD